MLTSKKLSENQYYLNNKIGVGESFDVDYREFIIHNKKVVTYFITGLCDSQYIIEIFKKLTNLDTFSNNKVFDLVLNNLVHQQVVVTTEFDMITTSVLSGLIAIFIEDDDRVFIVDVRNYPTRSPKEPDTEKVVRGSRDGYTENIIINTALTRRRVRDPNLRIEIHQIGSKSIIDVCLLYIIGITKPELINEARYKIQNVNTDELIMTEKKLEEIITEQGYNPYPKVRYTERPDIVATHLYQGQVGILVDTSPSVILTPVSYFDHIQHAEEYRQTAFVGTFLRLSRFGGILASLFLVPIWLLFVLYPEYLPNNLSFIGPEDFGNVPIIWQILIAEIGIEFLRMAAIHTPSALSTAMGIIAGVIIGQIAIEVGLFCPEIVLYAAVSQIGSYATPSYEMSLANKLSKIFFILSLYFFGLYGLITAVGLWFLFLANMKTMGKYYLYPLIPFNGKDLLHIIIRPPFKNN